MKRIAVALVALVGLSMGACCPIDKKAVSDVESSYAKGKKHHLQYVEADPKLSKEDKDDWKKFYESYGRLIESLQKAVD